MWYRKPYDPPYRVFATDQEGNPVVETLVFKESAAALYNIWRFQKHYTNVHIKNGKGVVVYPKTE